MVFIAFLVSILIVLVLIGLYRSRKFSPVLIVSLALYMGFWNFFPLLYSTLAKQRTLNIILNSMYIRVAVLQLVSSFVIIVMLYLIGRFRPATPRALRTGRGDISANAVVRLLILTLILIVIMDLRSILTIGYRFAERVQFVVSDINRSDVLGSVLSLAGSYALPFAIACLLARFDKYHRDRRITFLAFGIIALQVTFLIMVGVRAYVLLPIELMMLYLIVNRKKVVPIAKAGIILLVLGWS